MKSVLISIKPKFCELIANGKKTIEVRKTRPKLETPFKVYIYCTKGRGDCLWEWRGHIAYDTQFPNERPNRIDGKVIGEFVCDRFDTFNPTEHGISCNRFSALHESCLSVKEMRAYANGKPLYGWHISDLKIYEKPKEFGEFKTVCKDAYYRYGDWYCKDGYGSCAVRDKEKEYPYNEECIYFDCPTYGECCEYEDYAYCNCNGLKPVIRPPQSWCYVKE